MVALSPEAMAIILAAALSFYAAQGVVTEAKKVYHGAKRGGAAVVHVLKKVGHAARICDGSDCLFDVK